MGWILSWSQRSTSDGVVRLVVGEELRLSVSTTYLYIMASDPDNTLGTVQYYCVEQGDCFLCNNLVLMNLCPYWRGIRGTKGRRTGTDYELCGRQSTADDLYGIRPFIPHVMHAGCHNGSDEPIIHVCLNAPVLSDAFAKPQDAGVMQYCQAGCVDVFCYCRNDDSFPWLAYLTAQEG